MILDPTREEMLAYLATQFELSDDIDGMDCDAEAAMYWFAVNYHSGMFSNLYEASCNSVYSPGVCTNGPDPDSGEEMMYQSLEHEFAGKPFPEETL